MAFADHLKETLQQAFSPEQLIVEDVSHQHQGHAGARPGGESHFSVLIVAPIFHGLPKIKRHKLVYKAIEKEMKEQIHALSLALYTPEEYGEK